MSETIYQAGIAIKTPFKDFCPEFVDWIKERVPDIKLEIEEDEGEIEYVECISKKYSIDRGSHSIYVCVFTSQSEDDLEFLVSSNDILDLIDPFTLKHESGNCRIQPTYRIFAHSWYTGTDHPSVYWEW